MSYKLGKLEPKEDKRTLSFKLVLENIPLPPLPESYDIDNDCLNVNIPESLFGNDRFGDCVIAYRANQTLRFEQYSQKKVLPITTNDCLNEYWKEGNEQGMGSKCAFVNFISGRGWNSHPDKGLIVLDSLNSWRKDGWNISDGRNYKIYAYAKLNIPRHQELKYAITLLSGAGMGITLPQSAMDQFHSGQPWTVVNGSPKIGGHMIYAVGYNAIGPIIITWGKKVQMDWEFYDLYADEVYAIIDDKDSWLANDPLDTALLDKYLSVITQQ